MSANSPAAGKKNNLDSRPTLTVRKLAVALALCFGAEHAVAVLPSGQNVLVPGSATITAPSSNGLLVNVTSNKAVINWNAFSISNGNSVQFVQPNSSAVVLNRVTGSSASDISGNLLANGQVFLVNPNGIFFGATAHVDVGGLVASTLDISDTNFMNGVYAFSKVGGSPTGQVVNNGSISASGAYAALLGEQVSNGATGVISSAGGKIALLGGEGVTLSIGGNQLLSFTIPQTALNNAAFVQNSAGGQLLADGGSINMAARVANVLSGAVVNQAGVVRAQGVAQKNGQVYLSADGGDLEVSGSINVGGLAGGTATASLIATGGSVNLRNGSSMNVSGDSSAAINLQSSNQVNLTGDVLAQSASGAANVSIAANAIALGSANVAATGFMSAYISVSAGNGSVTQNADGQLRAVTSATEQQAANAGGGAFAGIVVGGVGSHTLGGTLEAGTAGQQAQAYLSVTSDTGSVSLNQAAAHADGSGNASDIAISAAGNITGSGAIGSSAGAGPASVTMNAGGSVTLGGDLTVSGISGTDRATLASLSAGSGNMLVSGRISITDTTAPNVASNGAGLGLNASQGRVTAGDISVTSVAGPAQVLVNGTAGVALSGDVAVSGQSALVNVTASGTDIALATGKTVLAQSTSLGGGGALVNLDTPSGTLHIAGSLRAQAPGNDSARVITNPLLPVAAPAPGSSVPAPLAATPVVLPPSQSVLTRLLNITRSTPINPLAQNDLIVMPAWNIVTRSVYSLSTFDAALFGDEGLNPTSEILIDADPINAAMKK